MELLPFIILALTVLVTVIIIIASFLPKKKDTVTRTVKPFTREEVTKRIKDCHKLHSQHFGQFRPMKPVH